jgi:valyl-tRNA synthetase
MPTELPKNYDPALVEPEANRVWTDENLFHAEPSDPGDPYCIVIPPPNVTGALHLGHAINNTIQDVLIRQHRMRGFNTLWMPGLDHAGIATQAVVEKQLKEKENKTRHDVGREGLVERIWAWKQQYGDRILSQLKRLGCSCDWDRTRFTLDEVCARAVRETFFKLFKDGLIYRGKRLVNWDTFLQTSISDDEIYHETVKTNLWHIRYPIVDGGNALTTENTESTEKNTEKKEKGEGSSSSSPSVTSSGSSVSSVVNPSSPRPDHMVVATTRPETLLGDTAVAVHSQDPRWNWAIGKHVRLPLTDRLIPIIADDILVDPKFGTGVVKVTPAHDPNDYAVWQRHKGQADEIDLINILTPDGRLADDARWQKYAGLKRDVARLKVVEDLKAAGLLEKEEPYETQVGHSDRSKTPIEPYLSDQWFVKMAPLAEPALQVVRDETIKFFPARFANTYLDWLGEKRDWPISRQLWWGHRIPIWSLRIPAEIGKEEFDILTSACDIDEMLDVTDAEWAVQIVDNQTGQVIRTWSDIEGESLRTLHGRDLQIFVCKRRGDWNEEFVKQIEGLGYQQDPDVLDTWFSSALWPHSTLGWPEQTPALKKWYPTSVLVTSRDIITLWVARMVMTGMYNMGEKQASSEGTPLLPPLPPGEGRGEGELRAPHLADRTSAPASPHPNPLPRGEGAEETFAHGREVAKRIGIPFGHVHIHATILDGKGERMSKSKGNGVDPVDIIETHGADALRFTLMQMATETQDARLPVKKDKEGRNTSEKFDVGKHFCNKIWQVSQHFAIANLEKIAPEPADERKWSLADRWIVSRFNRTLEAANAAIASYRFDQYAKACYDFFWGDFCDWYVEAIKPALRDPQRAGQTATVLAAVLDGALRLMHPVIPFITEVIFWRLNEVRPDRGLPGRIELPASERLIKAPWPPVGSFAEAAEFLFPKIQEIIVAIRNLRTQYNVKPSQNVTVSIGAPGDSSRTIAENRELIELLATCTIKDVQPQMGAIPNSTHVTAAGCDLYLEGLVDPEAEKQLRAKKEADLERQIGALKGRLSNESYIAKAPPKLVQETRDQLAAAEAELRKLRGQ